jgi:hypothetical protein
VAGGRDERADAVAAAAAVDDSGGGGMEDAADPARPVALGCGG